MQYRLLSVYMHYTVYTICKLLSFFIAGNPEQFHYLNQGMSPIVQNIDDAEDFTSVRQAMMLLGKSHIHSTLCIILLDSLCQCWAKFFNDGMHEHYFHLNRIFRLLDVT